MIHHQPSPRNCAASTNSRLDEPDRDRAGEAEDLGRIEHGDRDDQHRQPRAEDRQDDEGEDQRRHREQQVDEPADSAWSTHPPDTAAAKPLTMPMKNDSAVMTSARPIDMRAP